MKPGQPALPDPSRESPSKLPDVRMFNKLTATMSESNNAIALGVVVIRRSEPAQRLAGRPETDSKVYREATEGQSILFIAAGTPSMPRRAGLALLPKNRKGS